MFIMINSEPDHNRFPFPLVRAAYMVILTAALIGLFPLIFPEGLDAVHFYNEIAPRPTITGIFRTRLYGLLMIALLLSSLLLTGGLLAWRRGRPSPRAVYRYIIGPVLLTLFLVLFSVQTLRHPVFFIREILTYADQPVAQRKIKLFGDAYEHALLIRARYPGYRVARIDSDFDFNESLGMTFHRRFSYFLYPIDTRTRSDETAPELIIFTRKAGAISAVPPGYRADYIIDDRNLVAVRKENGS